MLFGVADNLRNAHPLVRQTRVFLEKSRSNDDWQLREFWNKPRLDISVSKKLVRRALPITDAVLKALEARGFAVELSKENSATYAVINADNVKIKLRENHDRSERELTEEEKKKPDSYIYNWWIYTPNGKLTFTIDESWEGCRRKNWIDKEQRPLENQLNDVITGIMTAAEALRLRLAHVGRTGEGAGRRKLIGARRRNRSGERRQSAGKLLMHRLSPG